MDPGRKSTATHQTSLTEAAPHRPSPRTASGPVRTTPWS